MNDKAPGTFEAKVERLTAIVRELENGSVDLDKSVALFQEGKALARDCENLLKSAQDKINTAMQRANPDETDSEEIPF